MRTVVNLARRVVAFEVNLYRSLFRWVTRRPDVPPGSTGFPYVGAIATLLWAFVVVSAIELVAVHLLLPWETIRLVADLLGLWGLVWMLGLLASFNVHPHLVGGSGVRIRYGHSTDILVPWDAIGGVATKLRSPESSKTIQLDRGEDGTVLNVVVGSQTNVELTLSRPLDVPLRKGPETITAIRFHADDARGLVGRVRERLGEGTRR
jgi:hypothetical protein